MSSSGGLRTSAPRLRSSYLRRPRSLNQTCWGFGLILLSSLALLLRSGSIVRVDANGVPPQQQPNNINIDDNNDNNVKAVPPPTKQPNFLFLQTDSMDGRVLDPTSPLWNIMEMPNLRRVAANGVNFANNYSPSPQVFILRHDV